MAERRAGAASVIAALAIDGLTLARGERILLAGFAARLAAGEAVALTGPNGAGKTTLLRAIAGLIRPLAGTIRFEGRGGAPVEPDDARRSASHLLGHLDGLKSGRAAGEELDFQVRWCGGAREAGRAAAARLGLAPLLGLPVRALSAGQRRRLALIRLVACPRPLWLLDEPFTPLDGAHRALMGEVMAAHLAGGGLVLAAVHDPLPVAARALDLARP